MESLYVLIPLSVLLVLALLGVFAWAMGSGQFESLEVEGERILDASPGARSAPAPSSLDADQAAAAQRKEE